MRMRDAGQTGFCEQCDVRRGTENYLAKNAAAIDERRKDWQARTYPARTSQQREWDAERQRHHRLRETVRPRELPDPDCDPWELGAQAIRILTAVKPSVKSMVGITRLEEGLELVRQLAYGPWPTQEDRGASRGWRQVVGTGGVMAQVRETGSKTGSNAAAASG